MKKFQGLLRELPTFSLFEENKHQLLTVAIKRLQRHLLSK